MIVRRLVLVLGCVFPIACGVETVSVGEVRCVHTECDASPTVSGSLANAPAAPPAVEAEVEVAWWTPTPCLAPSCRLDSLLVARQEAEWVIDPRDGAIIVARAAVTGLALESDPLAPP